MTVNNTAPEMCSVILTDVENFEELEKWARNNCSGFLGTFSFSTVRELVDCWYTEFIFDNERDLIMFKLACV